MIIEFSSDLKKQHLYACGKELALVMGKDNNSKGNRIYSWPDSKKEYVATFNNPVLVTDNYKIGSLNPVLRDTVFALYAFPLKRIIYDSVQMDFTQGKFVSVWGPSIDTLLFCRSLKYLKSKNQLKHIKTAIEIGSGSGYISKYILEKNSNVKKITLIDINIEAKKCAEYHILDKRMNALAGDGMSYLKNKKFDLVICNPPYIPRITTIEENPYEGVGLLCDLIFNANNFLTDEGMLIVNISSLCEKTVLSAIKKSKLSYEKIDELKVPLKVFNVLNNKDWMKYLLKHSMKKENHNGYDYWQTLTIYKISKKR